jgi:predicted transposase/invertase (TIGR01784 family)
MKDQKLIRFDWAIKTILRDKANFDVLEGFLSALLKEDIQVVQRLESESNQDTPRQKFNRVDIMVQDSNQKHMIIEIQNEHEADFLERLLFGTSVVIVDNLEIGQSFSEVKK